MKKSLYFIVCAVALMLCFSACSPETDTAQSGLHSAQISEWPENEYTESIPKPETGTPVLETVNGAIYSVTLDGVSRQECYDYLELLTENGFESAFPGQENDASGGWIYTDGDATVTIGSSGDSMILGITFERV